MEGEMAFYQSSDGSANPFEAKLEYPDDGVDCRPSSPQQSSKFNDKAELVVETDDHQFIALDSDERVFSDRRAGPGRNDEI
jgi:hypothetical protein